MPLKKNAVKRMLVFITFVMIIIFVQAATMKTAKAANYSLWIAGHQVSDTALSGEGWSYNPESNTLTLDGFNYDAKGEEAFITIFQDSTTKRWSVITYTGSKALNIEVRNDNKLNWTDNYSSLAMPDIAGIFVTSADVKIYGTGTLSLGITNPTGKSYNWCLFVKNGKTTIENVTLTATCSSIGDITLLQCLNELTINNANVSVSGECTNSGTSTNGSITGIRGQGITINSGTVIADVHTKRSQHIGYGLSLYNGSTCIIKGAASSVNLKGTTQAIDGKVMNELVGTGWTDYEGTTGQASVPVSFSGRALSAYKLLVFKQPVPISRTVTFRVVNGSWDNGTSTDIAVTLEGYEGDTLKLASGQIPQAGTKPAEKYKAGSWDTTPDTETEITGDTTYTYTYTAKSSISRTVTFKVVNGSWDNDTNTDIAVTLEGYEGDTLKLASGQIPQAGTKPAEKYKAGSWNTTPDTETEIMENTIYTYTYILGQFTYTAPTAKQLVYNGAVQELVISGYADTGTMVYAAGTKAGVTGSYQKSVPSETEPGIYYVWYQVVDQNNQIIFGPFSVKVSIAPLDDLYIVESGWNQQYIIGDSRDLTFRIGRKILDEITFDRFDQHIQIDKQDVGSAYYTAKSGSIILTISSGYVDQLRVGKHTIKVFFSDGSVEIPFTVASKATPETKQVPKTGDNSRPGLWSAMMLLGLVGLSLIIIGARRREKR